MTLPDLITAYGALGRLTANHPVVDCKCTDCNLFMELADSISQTPAANIREAVRELAEDTVGRRQAAVRKAAA